MNKKEEVKEKEKKEAKLEEKTEEKKKDIVEETKEVVEKRVEEAPARRQQIFDKEAWKPKTEIGRLVKDGTIKSIDEILDKGIRILETGIIEVLLPDLEQDLIKEGQSKGKFGGGKKSIWKQTQKKTKESNKPKFSTTAVVGNRNGYVGMGQGRARETVPAREKAFRNARLDLIKVYRGCGSWECPCNTAHSIPFKITGKSGSVIVELKPAPKGTGLVVDEEIAKLLQLAGIEDVYSKTYGQTGTRSNLIKAAFGALKNLSKIKVIPNLRDKVIIENVE